MNSSHWYSDNDGEAQFPPGCSWRCYIGKNRDLFDAYRWDEVKALEHYLTYGKEEHRDCLCEVVLLPGPHKAASTTLQDIAVKYSSPMAEHVPWNWVVPPSNVWEGHWSLQKATAAFPLSYYLNNPLYFPTNFKKKFGIDYTFDEIKGMLKEEVEKQYYQEGYNIILGNEEMDRVTMPKEALPFPHRNSGVFLSELWDLFPKEAIENDLITALIVYRGPRIDHLKSTYKQSMTRLPEGTTFYERLQVKKVFEEQLGTIDSPLLAKTFLEAGYKVKILDMSGVLSTEGIEFFSVLGCDIMGLFCEYNKDENALVPLAFTEQSNDRSPKAILNDFRAVHSNARDDENYNFNMTTTQFNQIDSLLRRYDCATLPQLLADDNVEVLYGDQLIQNTEWCKLLHSKDILYTQEELFQAIQEKMNDWNVEYYDYYSTDIIDIQ